MGLRLKRFKTKIGNGIPHTFLVPAHGYLRFCGGLILALTWLALSAAQAQTTNFALGATVLVVGPAAGTNSVVLGVTPATGAWTATTNAAWLHLSATNRSGIGSTNVIFSYDANSGATRSGTLTIAGQTLTVTQAGSTYVAAETLTTLVSSNLATPLNLPQGVAVDGLGNVYIADLNDNAIKEWTAANNIVAPLVSAGLLGPFGVAVDGAGNVYINDAGNYAIKEWTEENSNVITLVSSGLRGVYGSAAGVAVDSAGNVYIADFGNSSIKEWTADNSIVTTLVAYPEVVVPYGVAVDGAGNVYIADSHGSGLLKWMAANGILTTLLSSESFFFADVAVDSAGNIYLADTENQAIEELPYAFVDPTPKLEGLAAGSDVLPAVLPPTENLLPPFAPTSDQSWLTVTGVTNGVVSFAFTANTGPARTANVTLLGQTIPITQGSSECRRF